MSEKIKLRIKPVEGTDIGALRSLSVDFFKEFDQSYPITDDNEIDSLMLKILTTLNDPTYIYLIAYTGKKPIGFALSVIGVREWSRPRRVGIGQQLYVVPDKRGGKVALRLMEESAARAIASGAEGLECVGSYAGTAERWEKFGFKPYMVYGHMPNEDFMKLVQKFTKGGN